MTLKTNINNGSLKDLLFFTLILILISIFLMTLSNDVTLVDEYVHTSQIIGFQNGNNQHFGTLTTFTTYHHIIAFIADLFNTQKLFFHRTINLFFSISMIYVFFLICGKISKPWQLIKSIQFVFTPILFPFYFLVYTDIFALLMVLLMVYFYLQNKAYISLLFATISILIRQPSLMWFGLIPGMQLFYLPNEKAINILKKLLPWIIIGLAFIAYFISNKGVALGDKKQHNITFNITNFYFLVLVSFFIYFPIFIGQFKSIFKNIVNQKWLFIILLAGLPFYFYTFSVEHIYNHVQTDYFIRNYILLEIAGNQLFKILSYFIFSYSCLAIYSIKLVDKKWNLIYLLSFISVVPMPLIEQRYYIIAISLWQLTRTMTKPKFEYINAVWMVATSIIAYIYISNGKIFL